MGEVLQGEDLKAFLKTESKDNDNMGINRVELDALKKIVDKDKDGSLDKNILEEFNKKENITQMLDGISRFLNNPSNLTSFKSISTKGYETIKSYENILKFLETGINQPIGNRKDQFTQEEKNRMNAEITSLFVVLKEQETIVLNQIELNKEKEKSIQDVANEAKLEKEGPVNFLKMIKEGLTSNKDSYGIYFINNLFDNSPDLVSKTLKMFMDNYNYNNENKLTKKNLTEQMYNISPEQKDLFAGYLAEVIVANSQEDKRGGPRQLGKERIPLLRKNIYPLLFREDQQIPLLLAQKRIIVGNKTGTEGIVSGYKADFGVKLFNYNEKAPRETTSNIGWLPGQKTLDVSFLASGVDHNGASIDIKIGEVLIKGVTKGVKKDSKNQTDENLIDWKVLSGELPKGLSIQGGSIKIDSKVYGSKPNVGLNIVSLVSDDKTDNDEVMIRAATNGQFDSIAGNNEASGMGAFESGKRELSEEGKNTFAEQVKGIKENINMRLPRGTKLIVNMGSGVDKTPVSPELEKTLQTEVSDLKVYLSSKGYTDLIQDMDAKSDNGGFVDQGNKLLAQARFLTGLKYMIENLKQDPKYTNTYLDKLEFKVTEIKQTKNKRYFDFEMSKYAVKAKTDPLNK